MKALLALSLLLFLDFVFSQGDIFPCPIFTKCPYGYFPVYSGPSMNNAVCLCKKKPKEDSPCGYSFSSCLSGLDPNCSEMESICSPKEIINFCSRDTFHRPEICDRANQRLRKENPETRRPCEFYKTQCKNGDIYYCPNAEACDEDIIQQCKNKKISLDFICEEAEIRQEKERAEDTKYSCNYAKNRCQDVNFLTNCPDIAKFCDVETAAKWCYKDDRNLIERISDEECSRVVKKSQYLMFGQSKPECWEQVPLCEGGNSEACMQVATFCVKEVVSALCNTKKIKNKRICTYAGSDKTASPSYPGCNFFADKCNKWEAEYCQLASRYCDNYTINTLCSTNRITDSSICKRVQGGNNGYFLIPIPITIPVIGGTVRVPNIFGL